MAMVRVPNMEPGPAQKTKARISLSEQFALCSRLSVAIKIAVPASSETWDQSAGAVGLRMPTCVQVEAASRTSRRP